MFAERCADDRHHFRFIVSPEDAAELQDQRTFARELMDDAERNLQTKLDWVGTDHWNTDNPHIHIFVRGRTAEGDDLVICRDYISRGLRHRAESRVSLELGPRSQYEIAAQLSRESVADRWTDLDRRLEGALEEDRQLNVRDLSAADARIRQALIGRLTHLSQLGLAAEDRPGAWRLDADAEATVRGLDERRGIVDRMHRDLEEIGRVPEVSRFAIHEAIPGATVIGRLVSRGFCGGLDETAYAIVDGLDGRVHHLQFHDIEVTGDAAPGAIVGTNIWTGDQGKRWPSLGVRCDLPIERRVAATGATWLDRQLVAAEPTPLGSGFGSEVAEALERRANHLVAERLATRDGGRIMFVRNLLSTLTRRELERAASRISAETGLEHRALDAGDTIAGRYRQRLLLASGRFAMVDDGVGFALLPWRPALEQQLGREVAGTLRSDGRVDWSHQRQRALEV